MPINVFPRDVTSPEPDQVLGAARPQRISDSNGGIEKPKMPVPDKTNNDKTAPPPKKQPSCEN